MHFFICVQCNFCVAVYRAQKPCMYAIRFLTVTVLLCRADDEPETDESYVTDNYMYAV